MKKKILIGAGIVLAIFIVFLIAICGASGGSHTVSKEKLDQTIDKVVCEVKDDNPIEMDFSILSNDIEFDSEILNRNYTKIDVNTLCNFKSLGVAFRLKPQDNSILQISLMKNDECLATQTIEAESGLIENVNLLLDTSVEVKTTDNFYISISNSNNAEFVFDTMIFFFDEV